MKRFYLIILALWVVLTTISAQELTVKEMKAAGNDISVSRREIRPSIFCRRAVLLSVLSSNYSLTKVTSPF